ASALRVDGRLVYLDRYWREEQQVCEDVLTLVTARPPGTAPASERLFPAGYEEQRTAADAGLFQGPTVLTGGPSPGATPTAPPLRIALSAPTGKAAARLQEAVQLEVDRLDLVDRRRLSGLQATTLHRLLGPRPDSSSRFRHHRANRLPHDVIVVDETSMVSLT